MMEGTRKLFLLIFLASFLPRSISIKSLEVNVDSAAEISYEEALNADRPYEAGKYRMAKGNRNNNHQKNKLSAENSNEQSLPAPNLLVITTDEHRYDLIGLVQSQLKLYEGRFKIRTPNLDRLAQSGVIFPVAYCHMSSCVPSRATIRTGCAVGRHGVLSNTIMKNKLYLKQPLLQKRVEAAVTYDHVLVERLNYTAEQYGKFHLPEEWYYAKRTKNRIIYTHDDYSFEYNRWSLLYSEKVDQKYRANLRFMKEQSKLQLPIRNGLQVDYRTTTPYMPISLDSRFGLPTNTLRNSSLFTSKRQSKNNAIYGFSFLPSNYSSSGVMGTTIIRTIERLAAEEKKNPFVLTASFSSPHPPYTSSPEFSKLYWEARDRIAVPPNVLRNNQQPSSDYPAKSKYTPNKIQELSAILYAMVEEVDYYVGEILETLERTGFTNNTMVIFTADHGAMLGSHGREGKAILLEEAVRVPLIMSFPGRIQPGTTVNQAVSHLDLFATIMDYLNASEYDESDGSSLRRYIEQTGYNRLFDEDIVVCDDNQAKIVRNGDIQVGFKGNAHYMIRKGDYKLLITKKADSKNLDILYNVARDPYETRNLLSRSNTSPNVVGKAEHLKILLVEWMQRNDGKDNFYSNPMYNGNVGNGDIREIRNRRTWRSIDYWQSDTQVLWGTPALVSGKYIRYEYFYVGRTKPGFLRIKKMKIKGPDRKFFKIIGWHKGKIKAGEHKRIKLAFRSSSLVEISSLRAELQIYTTKKNRRVKFK